VRVTRQLLVLLVNVLSRATDLHTIGPVGIERSIRVMLRLPAIATATAVASTLTLHTLEISHVIRPVADRQRVVADVVPSDLLYLSPRSRSPRPLLSDTFVLCLHRPAISAHSQGFCRPRTRRSFGRRPNGAKRRGLILRKFRWRRICSSRSATVLQALSSSRRRYAAGR
jgi:hypothetical protein